MNTETPSTLAADQERGAHARMLYSYPEARQLLGGIPESTFAVWIANGWITPVRIGPRRCFIRYEDLQRLRMEGTPEVPKARCRAKGGDYPKAG